MRLPTRLPQLNLKLGRRGGAGDVVGLDIQPGFVAAVQARVNGAIIVERAELRPLGPDTMRDGEVIDDASLAEVLRDLFGSSGLSRNVRVGVANQRTVLRTLELPPVTDEKELAAAVTFQAQDQVPMPLNNAVLDFHPLGIVDTPAGPRQRVVLVAAQRDMVERLLAAVRAAGLNPAGVDLSAFALIRSLYRPEPDAEQASRIMYLNVDGLTNLAIAEGKICRFTRVVGSGLEGMAVELAERRGIALTDARELLAGVDLREPAPTEPEPAAHVEQPPVEHADAAELPPEPDAPDLIAQAQEAAATSGDEDRDTYEMLQGFEDQSEDEEQLAPAAAGSDKDVWNVLENGIREISGEVRNSLDFHRSQDGGGEVSHVVLSGAAEDIPGFADALELALGVDVRSETVSLADEHVGRGVSKHRLAVATGLAATEAPQ
jgi:type IV pilus assembly protein PilM